MRVKVNVLICILVGCLFFVLNLTGKLEVIDGFLMAEKKYPAYWEWLNQYSYTYGDEDNIKIFPVDKKTFNDISTREKKFFVSEVQHEMDDYEYAIVDFMDGTCIKVDSELYYGELTSDYRIKENAERVDLNKEYSFSYEAIENNLRNINGLGSYLVALNKLDVDIFASVKDEGASTLKRLSEKTYEALGMKQLRKLGYRYSYVFVSDKNGNITEKNSNGKIEIDGKVDDINYHVISQGWDAGNYSSIVLNGLEMSQNSRGLNFAVVKKDGTLIDSVCFDTCDGKTIKRN